MKNRKIFMLLFVLGIMSLFIGGTWAFFNYSKISGANEIVSGQVYFDFTDESEGITLTNAFPMSATDARTRTDNTVSFSITGRDTYNKPIYYEIDLVNGEVIDGKEETNRILTEYLRFDLIEDGNLVLDNVSYDNIENRRIYVNTIEANTTSDITRNYTLRMWIDEDLTISDTDTYADYTTSEYENLFASIKVRVIGDFDAKKMANLKRTSSFSDSFWLNDINSVKENIISVDFLNISDTTGDGIITESSYNTRYNTSTIKADVTGVGKPVTVWLEPVDTNYKMYVASESKIIFPEDCSYMFRYFENLKNIYFYDNVDTSLVQNISYMFYWCSKLETLDLSNFDTSNLVYINSFIALCDSLTEINMSNWNMVNVNSYMGSFFSSAPNLETINLRNSIMPENSGNYMFYMCRKLKNLDVTNMDVSRVKTMYMWFEYCENIEELDLSTWNTNSVENIELMFYECTKLKRLDLSGWDLHNVTKTTSFNFYFPANIEYINMSNVIFMPNCSDLFILRGSNYSEELELILTNADTSYVTNMGEMFYDCRTLKSLDLSSFDTSNVTYFGSMFSGCRKLASLNISGWDMTGFTSSSSNVNFYFPQSLETIDASNIILPVNCKYLFNVYNGNIKEIDLTNADSSRVTNMYEMFYGLKSLTNLDLSSFDTSNVTDMSYMFSGCTSLQSINLSSFNTSSVTDISKMFEECSSLINLDLNSFNTSNVVNMYGMFYNCTNLNKIYVGNNWSTSSVTSGNDGNIFYENTSLVGGNGTTYDSSHIDVSYAHVDEEDNPGYLTLKS